MGFVPTVLWEKDAELYEQYCVFCQNRDLSNVFDEHEQEKNKLEDKLEDTSDDSDKEEDAQIRKLLYSPPLYDQKDLYHPVHERDFGTFCFTSQPSIGWGALLLPKLRGPDHFGTRAQDEALSIIQQCRKSNPLISNAMKSMITLRARLAGIKQIIRREIKVPGNMLLSTLHDRVLCPVFGWTRACHDYRYAFPPRAYPMETPPRFPMMEILVGPEGSCSMFTNRFGFYGTLRSQFAVVNLPESKVCVADLLFEKDHELWHVISGGWKTEITVVELSKRSDPKTPVVPSILFGEGRNVPESLFLSFQLSEFEEVGCRGPHAYALAIELLRPLEKSEESLWYRNFLIEQLPSNLDRNCFTQSGSLLIPLGACNGCLKTASQLKKVLMRCQRSKNVLYCSKQCQAADRKQHKKLCLPRK